MNLYLHSIDADPCPIRSGVDSLGSDPGERFSVVMTYPPFGKKSSIAIVNEAGDLEKEDSEYVRQDFWTTTKNKQLNFLQHARTLLKVNGRCAIVVPDNVLFEGGAGEVEHFKPGIGHCARVETGCVRWCMGCAEGVGQVPGVQRSNSRPMKGATVKMATLGEVHENDPYWMASNKLRSTGSLGVPTRSRGFSPPS
jgi:hypothetical protein